VKPKRGFLIDKKWQKLQSKQELSKNRNLALGQLTDASNAVEREATWETSVFVEFASGSWLTKEEFQELRNHLGKLSSLA
jgi:hypothetical protein